MATGAPTLADMQILLFRLQIMEYMDQIFMKFCILYDIETTVYVNGMKRLNDFFTFVNTLSSGLKFTMEVGGNKDTVFP